MSKTADQSALFKSTEIPVVPRNHGFAQLPADPLVSIIVRTHGQRLGFLQEAVASIIAQDYRPLEIVVVEDGTTNASEWIVEQQARLAAENLKSITLTYNPVEQGGRCRAGNAGLLAAQGELCGFLDDDDLFLPGHVTTLVSALKRQTNCGAAYAIAWEVPTQIESLSPLRYRELKRFVSLAHPFDADALARRNLTSIQSVLFRSDLFRWRGGLDERLDALEDWDLWRRYSSAAPFAFVNEITSLYRVPGDPESARRRQLIFRDYQETVERLWRLDPGRQQLSASHQRGIGDSPRSPREPKQQQRNSSSQPLEAQAVKPSLFRGIRATARDFLLKRPRLYACWWHVRLRTKRNIQREI
ncbi:MAG: glycosyltransferase family 2 protein [Pirellulales bacterium]|nr:glycosyltransferase family 2 protein [Pirellulales bacterium]